MCMDLWTKASLDLAVLVLTLDTAIQVEQESFQTTELKGSIACNVHSKYQKASVRQLIGAHTMTMAEER